MRSLIPIALVATLACGSSAAAPASTPDWGDVRVGLGDLQLALQPVGQVELFEATRGMKEDVRLLKVRLTPEGLTRLLGPFGVITKTLGSCEAKALPAWSKSPAWKLPPAPLYRCGAGRLKATATGADWLVLAVVADDVEGKSLAYVTLLRGS